jgi:hypothetical protein
LLGEGAVHGVVQHRPRPLCPPMTRLHLQNKHKNTVSTQI